LRAVHISIGLLAQTNIQLRFRFGMIVSEFLDGFVYETFHVVSVGEHPLIFARSYRVRRFSRHFDETIAHIANQRSTFTSPPSPCCPLLPCTSPSPCLFEDTEFPLPSTQARERPSENDRRI